MWIAKTDGATSGVPTDLREAELTDIPVADRANWREVSNAPPTYDRLTQQAYRTGIAIAVDGSVATTWTIAAEPALVAQLNLVALAGAQALVRIQAGRRAVLGREVSISDDQMRALNDARLAADRGLTPVSMVTADGDIVTVNSTQLNTATATIATAREAIFTARQTIVTAIRAGTVTTSAAVLTHAAWP